MEEISTKIIYDTYLLCYCPSHHKANKDGYVRIHILQAEKKIGRLLKDGECVHHIDENKHNNKLDNLIVFRTVADHSAFHKGVRAVLCDDGIWECPTKNIKNVICPICGQKMSNNKYNMCISCYHNIGSVKIPPRHELKYNIYNNSFEEVGRKYNVAGNTIKIWCKKYNLPYLKNEIKLIPINEWNTENLSQDTQNKILMYYDERNASEQYIISYYIESRSLEETSKKFHKDRITLKNILIKHNIKIFSRSESVYNQNFNLYKDNVKIGNFSSIKDLALWFIDNDNNINFAYKTLRRKVSDCIKTGKSFCNYTITKV